MSTNLSPDPFASVEESEKQSRELHSVMLGLVNVALRSRTASPQAVYGAAMMLAADAENMIALITDPNTETDIHKKTEDFLAETRRRAVSPLKAGREAYKAALLRGADYYDALEEASAAFRTRNNAIEGILQTLPGEH